MDIISLSICEVLSLLRLYETNFATKHTRNHNFVSILNVVISQLLSGLLDGQSTARDDFCYFSINILMAFGSEKITLIFNGVSRDDELVMSFITWI